MADTTRKELDPKLRRQIASLHNPRRLRADLGRAVLSATEPVADGAEEAAAENLTRRVLVRLSSADVPAAAADLDWHELVEGIYSLEVPITRLGELADLPQVEYVEAGRILAPNLDTSLPETRADRVHQAPAGAALNGTGVVVGIIDFGLDFTLDDFRNEDGTSRIAFLWDQFLTPGAGESSPIRFGYGVEYTKADLDAALASPNPLAAVRHDPGVGSHGTHVAGIAAGNGRSGDAAFPAGRFVGAAPGATLIYVQPSSGDQTTTFTDSVHVAEAVAYVFDKAGQLGLPCVINMSLGQNGGSHDGESLVERAIDRLLESPGRVMTVAAGNEHVFRGHAGATLAEGETRTLHWRFGGAMPVPGGGFTGTGFDFTPNELEIWYSSRDRFRVRLIAPNGEASPAVEPGETVVHDFAGGASAFIDSERFTVLNGDARVYLEVAPPPAGGLPQGRWQVEIEGIGVVDGRFDAWIERDARRRSNNFADQSFFEGVDFDGLRTLGTPSTGRRTVAVANYDHVAQVPSDSSGRGTTRDGRLKPELAAPGTDILSSSAGGGRPDGAGGTVPMRVSMSGTSMSAPHVAGIAALLLERHPLLTAPQTAKILIACCRPPVGVAVFDDAWGFGRVDAEAAVALLDDAGL